MKKSRELGMQTFDQALFDLYTAGEISYEHALAHADSANDLRLMIKLETNPTGSGEGGFDDFGRGLSLEEESSRPNTMGRPKKPS